MKTKMDELCIVLDNQKYLTVRDFATIVKRSEQTVRRLLSTGNRFRKLKFRHIAGKPFILANEVFHFPFTLSGRNFNDVFNFEYNEKGQLFMTRAEGYCSVTILDCDEDCEHCTFYKKIGE